MKVRLGLSLAASVSIIAGACAAGAGTGGGAPQPESNEYTTQAAVYLSQAQNAEEDSVAENRYEQALEAANEGIEADSTNAQSLYQAGLSLVMLDRNYERADSLLSRATELFPDYEPDVAQVREQAWVNLYNSAIGPLNAGNYEEAERLFQLANQMFDDRPEAFLNLGSIYAQQGEAEQAIEAFRQGLEAARTQAEMLAQADTVDPVQQEQAQQSEELAVQNLGQLLTQTGQSQEAVSVYQEYLNDNPDDIQVLSNLAVALNQAEMSDSAQAIYDNLLSREGLNARDLGSIGVGLYQAEQFDRAADAFQRALDMNPRNRDAAYNLAQAYFAGEMWEQALEASERALELDPHNGNIYKLRARSFAETGDQAQGGRVLEEYEELSFELQGLQFQPSGNGGGTINGTLTNHSVPEGEPIIIEFHYADTEGNQIGTEEQTIPAPAQGDSRGVEVLINSDQEIGGYWYDVVQP